MRRVSGLSLRDFKTEISTDSMSIDYLYNFYRFVFGVSCHLFQYILHMFKGHRFSRTAQALSETRVR